MLNDIGAENTRSNPYCPAQNGVAERSNRTLVELARTVLIDSKLEKSLWAEAINYVSQILNATTINKKLNISA